MLPETRSSRRIFVGACLTAWTVGAVALWHGLSPDYAPSAPAYRQKGPSEAPIVIAEFSDFQCPACASAVEPLKLMQTIYPGKVRVVFKHNPWAMHPHAREAAVAAECAGRAGAFWAYHDALYSHQADWAKADSPADQFLAFAKEAGLDEASFKACLAAPEPAAAVDADFKEGRRRWVLSTPTFFINGRRFVGANQLRTLGRNRVEDLLKK